MLKWNGGAGSLIRVGLRESEGEERETMILVNEHLSTRRSAGKCINCLNTVYLSPGSGSGNPGQGGRDGISRREQALSLFPPSKMMKSSVGL